MLEHYEGENYHILTVLALTEAAKDGRSSTLTVYENNPENKKKSAKVVQSHEKNQGDIEKWINLRMKKGLGFGFHLRFKQPTLVKQFSTVKAPAGSTTMASLLYKSKIN